MSESLIRKYRPKKFSGIVGQEAAVKTVTDAIRKGVLPPAYIAYGLQGCGKTTIARLIAMSLNCKNKEGVDPCGTCLDCQAMLSDSHPMLVEIDAASHSGVADMRDLIAGLVYMVPSDQFKVIVIDECQALSKASWQASLKSVESPPERVIFVFCTTEYQSVPNTIVSRCVQLQFAAVSNSVILHVLRGIMGAEAVEYEEGVLEEISALANGSIRDAESILEAFIRSGKVTKEMLRGVYKSIDPYTIVTYFTAIVNKTVKTASNITMGWIRMGATPELMVKSLMEHLRNMLMDWNVNDPTVKEMLRTQREKIGDGKVSEWIEFFYNQLNFIRNYPMNYTVLMDMVTIRLVYSDAPPKKKGADKSAQKEAKDIADSGEATVQNTDNRAIDPVKLTQFLHACKGTAISTDIGRKRVTIRNGKGTVCDIVVDAQLATTQTYILDYDLETATRDYPANIGSVIKRKVS